MEYNLWKCFGLQRSGNHAIINWIIGLDQENTFFFNMVSPGKDLLDKPSAISLPEGTRSYVTRVDGKRTTQDKHLEWFYNNGGKLLLSYENYPMGNFSSTFLNHPAINRFGNPVEERNLLILRNPFNMLPSAEKMLRRTMVAKGKDEKWLADVLRRRLLLWKSYAFLHLHPQSVSRGAFTSLIFDHWVNDRRYRDSMANKLGYVNEDKFIDFVSDAGGGSSFTGSETPQKSSVLNRWEDTDSVASSLVKNNSEVIDYTAEIFGEQTVPAQLHGAQA